MPQASKGAVAPKSKEQESERDSKPQAKPQDKASQAKSAEASKEAESPRSSQTAGKEAALQGGVAQRGAVAPTGPGAVATTIVEVRPEEPTAEATPAVKLSKSDKAETPTAAFHRGLRRESSVAMDPAFPVHQVVEHSRRIDRVTGIVVAVDQEPLSTLERDSQLREVASQAREGA